MSGGLPRLRTMNRTVAPLPRRRGRRLLAASAVLGLALGLSACTIGEVDDDGAVGRQSAVTGPTDPAEATAGGGGQVGGDTPAVGLDQLIITAADAPEFDLQPTDVPQFIDAMSSIGSLTAQSRIEPAHCAEANLGSLIDQADAEALAIQTGRMGAMQVAVLITSNADTMSAQADQAEACPVITFTVPLGEMEATVRSSNSTVDLTPPEGVRDFAATLQDSVTTFMDQTSTTQSLTLVGTVRGIGISVSSTNPAGAITPEEQAATLGAFTRQAEKIRAA